MVLIINACKTFWIEDIKEELFKLFITLSDPMKYSSSKKNVRLRFCTSWNGEMVISVLTIISLFTAYLLAFSHWGWNSLRQSGSFQDSFALFEVLTSRFRHTVQGLFCDGCVFQYQKPHKELNRSSTQTKNLAVHWSTIAPPCFIQARAFCSSTTRPRYLPSRPSLWSLLSTFFSTTWAPRRPQTDYTITTTAESTATPCVSFKETIKKEQNENYVNKLRLHAELSGSRGAHLRQLRPHVQAVSVWETDVQNEDNTA